MTDLQYKVKELEESKDYWKKKYEELVESNRETEREKDKEERKSMIRIGGYGGIELPIDKQIKEAISDFVYSHVREMVEKDKELQKNFFKACLNYTKYFTQIFSPLIRNIVEDMDFTVRFDKDEYG